MEDTIKNVLEKAGRSLWSNDDIKMGNIFNSLLNQYMPGICEYISYDIITIENDALVTVDKIKSESEDIHRAYELEDKFNTFFSECDILKLYDLLNDGTFNDKLFIPIKRYDSALSMIVIENKSEFLELLDLTNGKNIYVECQLLIEILLQCIEKRNEFSQNGILLNENNTVKYTTVVHDIISSFFSLLEIPEISLFSSLSNTNYEGIANTGYIDFVKNTEFQCDIEFDNSDSYRLNTIQTRHIRKLLEMSNEEMHLIIKFNKECWQWRDYLECWQISGLGKYDENDSISISFNGLAKWKMKYKSEKITFNGSEIKLESIYKKEDENNTEIIKAFYDKCRTSDKNSDMNKLIEKLKEQKHGTMLVVTENAESEANRLCNAKRGISIKPIVLKGEGGLNIAKNISSIDGAILVDLNCKCYAIGVIVDGLVNPGSTCIGNTERGARYNSAVLYLNNIAEKRIECNSAMIVIVSEDGGTDIKTSFNI